jgi:hypothetical protein
MRSRIAACDSTIEAFGPSVHYEHLKGRSCADLAKFTATACGTAFARISASGASESRRPDRRAARIDESFWPRRANQSPESDEFQFNLFH